MKSTNALSTARRPSPAGLDDETSFSTLRDPRTASTSDLSQSSVSPHPDLSNEVAALSVKLVQAINNQTTLDDSLAATRQELEKAQDRVHALELENQKFRDDIANDVLVKRRDVESEIMSLKAAIAEERAQRLLVEKDKKNIEQELENLTAALFEEANKMVAAAKHEREAVEKKNEQLRAQIKDTEMLVASQQEQLSELKAVIQELNGARDEVDTHTNTSTAPPSPAAALQGNGNRVLDTSNTPSPVSPGSRDISPAPVHQLFPFDQARVSDGCTSTSKPPSRVSSGSYAGLNVMGLGSLAGYHHTPNGSTSSLSAAHSPNGSPQSPAAHIPLKETRFYKRVLAEDIEPALRLDTAPAISWLTRRSVLSSICDGGLIVEPMPAVARQYAFPCSLCGERRKGPENERTHRFRTSDSENAQRYALCMLCLEKVRACCEFTGYLRLILDGHIRIGDVEEEREAWEETVRLRERIFWARIGGGVIPTFLQTDSSRNPSSVDTSPQQPQRAEDAPCQDQQPASAPNGGSEPRPEGSSATDDPFVSDVKKVSIGGTVITAVKTEATQTEDDGTKVASTQTDADERNDVDVETQHQQNNLSDSLATTTSADQEPNSSELEKEPQPPMTPLRRDSEEAESKTEDSVPGAFAQ
ncbi:GDP/GTP exchange factor Sec2p [Rasamsonia emersonii CBS 393.64]|uniref:GDP/GTP exchange factor Sec2p n=1 Tax=Rasamsonia emersonii (strain ATCC 16479 / CBS 393.64 / IMI 116815) TaxID=1408163 RepID=A0A0F4YFX7_RASE3|nr:GDP/GTP exchange factor Sec2p [Rasamsonia emersonii CBS 393.64]KKA17079.1 GDP/GTP exchange factor Sec2p [Rasamsonia emersonii CBS 393.64]